MKTADPFLTSLCDDTILNGYCTKNICKANAEGTEVTVTKYGLDLAICSTKESEFLVNTIDSEGNKIPNIKLRIVNTYNGVCHEVETDANGNLVLNADEINGGLNFVCISKDYAIANGDTFYYAIDKAAVYATIPVLDIELKKVASEDTLNSLNINVVSDSTLLFSNVDMTVNLSNDENEYSFSSLGIGANSVEVAEGTYNVSVDNSDFTIDFPATVASGSDLTLKITPKATLKVYNSKEACKFSIINIDAYEDKVFEDVISFGVTVGQSIMVKDLVSENVYTATINGEGVTEVDLSSGVKAITAPEGSKYAPPTGDWIDWVILVLILALIAGAVCVVLLYKNNKNSKGHKGTGTATKMLSLLLVGAMTLSLASAPLEAFAGTDSDKPLDTIPGRETPPGSLQAYNGAHGWATLIKISLVPNDGIVQLTENAEEWQLAQRGKFNYRDSILYIAPNTNAGISNMSIYDSWMDGGDIISVWDNEKGVLGNGTTTGRVWWRGDVVNEHDRANRILPIARPESDIVGWEDEGFYKVILPFFYNRNVNKEFGKDLNTYMNERLNLNNANPDKADATQAFVNGYLNILKNKVGLSSDSIALYRSAFDNGTLSIMFETMIGLYIKGSGSADRPGHVYYMTTHDAMELISSTGRIEFPNREVGVIADDYANNRRGKLTCEGLGIDTNWACGQIGHFPNSTGIALMENYLRTLKPAYTKLEGQNPFGGWGFFNLGIGGGEDTPFFEAKTPGIYGEIIYKLQDTSGNICDTKVVEVDDYTFASRGAKLVKLGVTSKAMSIPNAVIFDGVEYTAKEQDIPITATITDNNGNKIADLDSSMVGTVDKDADGWSYSMVPLLPYVIPLNEQLTHEDGEPDHVKFTFEVVVTPTGVSIEGGDEVPQWRINKYWKSIMPMFPAGTQKAPAIVALNKLEADKGHATSYLSSEKGTKVRLTSPNLFNLPFLSNAKADVNLDSVAIKHASQPIRSIEMYGDFMAFKNADIDDLTTALWVTKRDGIETVYGNFRIESSTGEDKQFGNNFIKKGATLEYSYEPVFPIVHYRGVRAGHSFPTYRCSCYTVKDSTSYTKTPAIYDVEILFNCYNQRYQNFKSFTDTEAKSEGFAEFTQQGNDTIRLYAEYPMLFTDVAHQNSIRFMTADRATEFKPISYHTLQYNANVKPTISGVAATDSRAKEKLGEMGLIDPDFEAQMLPKGSATNTSYDVQGTLVAKTYALDLDSDAYSYKTKWNSKYSAQNVNEEFLNGFSSLNAENGNRTANLSMTENLRIDGTSYGNIQNEVPITAGVSDVDEYTLTVRAGEITAINGYRNWKTRYPELATVLIDKLKANHEGVFSVFNSGDGDELTEGEFAKLASAVREGSTSIAEGIGWYSEDTTLLTLYVYTTRFNLAGSTFANKIPSSISGLESPQDKSLFYSDAVEGNLQLDVCLQSLDMRSIVEFTYSTDNSQWADREYKLYAVPNVSVQDTMF